MHLKDLKIKLYVAYFKWFEMLTRSSSAWHMLLLIVDV